MTRPLDIFTIFDVDLNRLRKLYPNLASIAGYLLTGYVDIEDNGTEDKNFMFMRDPIKTCVYRFQYNVRYRKKNLVFEEWIQKNWTHNYQTRRIAGVSDVNQIIRIIKQKHIFVGLTERFDESIYC